MYHHDNLPFSRESTSIIHVKHVGGSVPRQPPGKMRIENSSEYNFAYQTPCLPLRIDITEKVVTISIVHSRNAVKFIEKCKIASGHLHPKVWHLLIPNSEFSNNNIASVYNSVTSNTICPTYSSLFLNRCHFQPCPAMQTTLHLQML